MLISVTLSCATPTSRQYYALVRNLRLADHLHRFNFNGLTTDGEKSYMQMIPTTDFDTALPDFQASRAKTLASLPPELPPADFLAALHGQSVSSSDLISTPTFNAPPATATADSKDVAANEALRGVYMSLFIPLSTPVFVCLMSLLIAL